MDRLTLKLIAAVAFFVVLGLAVGFHLTYTGYRDELLHGARNHAQSEAKLIQIALRDEMMNAERSLVKQMADSLSRDGAVERVMVLDLDGVVQVSSDPAIAERHFALEEPTCQVCHAHPPGERVRDTVLSMNGGAVLRSVQPILNEPDCHECHPSSDVINGVLIVDVPVGPTIDRMESAMNRLALGTVAMGVILIGGIGLAFRRFLFDRLARFESVARALAAGDLAQRVPVLGNDALTRIERQFNAMADSVGSLLARVRQQNERLERVMNSVDDGLVELDPSLSIVAANDAFVRRFPTCGEGTTGHACQHVIASGQASCDHATECPARLTFETGKVHTAIRTRRDPEGKIHHEEVRVSPLLDPDGKVARVVEVWRDITDRRSAEARLAEYQRLASVGMLASGFSHEINTPLSSIATCLEAVQGLVDGPDAKSDECVAEVKSYAKIASEQVQRCASVTKQFLRLVRGKSPENEAIDLRALAEQVARLVAPTARVRGVKVEVEPGETLPSVLASGDSVQQVLLNLLINAIEASPQGSTIRLSFVQNGEVAVHVRDEGCGMAAADVPQVFEPFFSKRKNGTGLGLFVSLNLARAWGGDVRVLASEPGRGTTFAVVFPRAGSRKDTPTSLPVVA